jgi:branched-chain amino acid aminotransferase
MEEAGTMNVFFRINDTFTAPVSERILDGVTRKVSLTLKRRYRS